MNDAVAHKCIQKFAREELHDDADFLKRVRRHMKRHFDAAELTALCAPLMSFLPSGSPKEDFAARKLASQHAEAAKATTRAEAPRSDKPRRGRNRVARERVVIPEEFAPPFGPKIFGRPVQKSVRVGEQYQAVLPKRRPEPSPLALAHTPYDADLYLDGVEALTSSSESDSTLGDLIDSVSGSGRQDTSVSSLVSAPLSGAKGEDSEAIFVRAEKNRPVPALMWAPRVNERRLQGFIRWAKSLFPTREFEMPLGKKRVAEQMSKEKLLLLLRAVDFDLERARKLAFMGPIYGTSDPSLMRDFGVDVDLVVLGAHPSAGADVCGSLNDDDFEDVDATRRIDEAGFCFRCGDGGEVVMCDVCSKVYHLDCARLKQLPEGKWMCPSHFCSLCLRKKLPNVSSDESLRCANCPRSFCRECWQSDLQLRVACTPLVFRWRQREMLRSILLDNYELTNPNWSSAERIAEVDGILDRVLKNNNDNNNENSQEEQEQQEELHDDVESEDSDNNDDSSGNADLVNYEFCCERCTRKHCGKRGVEIWRKLGIAKQSFLNRLREIPSRRQQQRRAQLSNDELRQANIKPPPGGFAGDRDSGMTEDTDEVPSEMTILGRQVDIYDLFGVVVWRFGGLSKITEEQWSAVADHLGLPVPDAEGESPCESSEHRNWCARVVYLSLLHCYERLYFLQSRPLLVVKGSEQHSAHNDGRLAEIRRQLRVRPLYWREAEAARRRRDRTRREKIRQKERLAQLDGVLTMRLRRVRNARAHLLAESEEVRRDTAAADARVDSVLSQITHYDLESERLEQEMIARHIKESARLREKRKAEKKRSGDMDNIAYEEQEKPARRAREKERRQAKRQRMLEREKLYAGIMGRFKTDLTDYAWQFGPLDEADEEWYRPSQRWRRMALHPRARVDPRGHSSGQSGGHSSGQSGGYDSHVVPRAWCAAVRAAVVCARDGDAAPTGLLANPLLMPPAVTPATEHVPSQESRTRAHAELSARTSARKTAEAPAETPAGPAERKAAKRSRRSRHEDDMEEEFVPPTTRPYRPSKKIGKVGPDDWRKKKRKRGPRRNHEVAQLLAEAEAMFGHDIDITSYGMQEVGDSSAKSTRAAKTTTPPAETPTAAVATGVATSTVATGAVATGAVTTGVATVATPSTSGESTPSSKNESNEAAVTVSVIRRRRAPVGSARRRSARDAHRTRMRQLAQRRRDIEEDAQAIPRRRTKKKKPRIVSSQQVPQQAAAAGGQSMPMYMPMASQVPMMPWFVPAQSVVPMMPLGPQIQQSMAAMQQNMTSLPQPQGGAGLPQPMYPSYLPQYPQYPQSHAITSSPSASGTSGTASASGTTRSASGTNATVSLAPPALPLMPLPPRLASVANNNNNNSNSNSASDGDNSGAHTGSKEQHQN